MRFRDAILLIYLSCFGVWASNAVAQPAVAEKQVAKPQEKYHSPYEVKFTNDKSELIADIEKGDRGDSHEQSIFPFKEWYSKQVRDKYTVWGPPAKHYPAAKIADGKSADWRRERLIAVGLRYVGYEYQHHHVPDWNPPEDWPWKKVEVGHNGRGLDGSNFSAFCYNQAFGIKFTSDIDDQAAKVEMANPDKSKFQAERIEIPTTYDDFSKKLKTGDLLFIKGLSGEKVTHVVIWVGKIGKSADDVPLILDSHNRGVKDSNKESIPAGIQLRPFNEKSWYYRSASHVHRVIRDDKN